VRWSFGRGFDALGRLDACIDCLLSIPVSLVNSLSCLHVLNRSAIGKACPA